MKGGYYRVDLNDQVSALVLNTLYYDSKRDYKISPDMGAGDEEMRWLEKQLSEDSARKFIITYHVYPGSRYNNFALWNDKPNHTYFDMLRRYKDRVIVEIGGHDHLASLRSHSGSDVLDLKDPDTTFDFHNLIIAPSFTPWYKNNPAVSRFTVDDSTLVPKGFESTYWNLKPTIGHPHIMSYPELSFRDLDYASDFGIDELTAESI